MLKYFKLDEKVKDPTFGTEGAACFDMHVHLPTVIAGATDNFITVYNAENEKVERYYYQKARGHADFVTCVQILPNERALIPTGLILDIPKGFSVRLHTRSSTSLKKGLIMPNGEGIIDYDYYHECFMMLLNVTNKPQWIESGERICQAELVKRLDYSVEETIMEPSQTTERVGGFGSTGK